MQNDIRWIQRYTNYRKALGQLSDGIELLKVRELTKLEKQGMIQAFEYTHELAWKTLKDFIESRGNVEIYGSKDASREAFRLGLIENGDAWMSMIKSRNLTSHTYDEATTDQIVGLIIGSYFKEFKELDEKLNGLKAKEVDL